MATFLIFYRATCDYLHYYVGGALWLTGNSRGCFLFYGQYWCAWFNGWDELFEPGARRLSLAIYSKLRCLPPEMPVRVTVTLQLTVSQSVLALSPSGTHDQILVVVKTVAVLFVERAGLSCNRLLYLSVLATYTYVHFDFLYKQFWFTFIVSFILVLHLLLCLLNTVHLCTCQACQPRFCKAGYAYCSDIVQGYNHKLDSWS